MRHASAHAPRARPTPRTWILPLLLLLTAALALAPSAGALEIGVIIEDEICADTPGGWGAPPAGENRGALLHAYFDDVFGDELVVGNLVFDDAQEVTDALPYSGQGGAFRSHAVALAINIAFGDAGLLDGTISDVEATNDPLVSTDDPYVGKTAVEMLDIAENILLTDSDIRNNEYSGIVHVMTGFNEERYGCHGPPDCPSDVAAIPQNDGSIRVTWNEVDEALEYGVYRATGESEDFVLLDTTEDTEYLDTTAAVGQTYRYMVTAWDGTFESEDCEAVAATSVPFFGALLGAVALVGTVGAYRWMRRK